MTYKNNTSTNTKYNDAQIKVNIRAGDTYLPQTKKIFICVTKNNKCNANEYTEYNATGSKDYSIDYNINEAYNGQTKKILVSVKDLAGNVREGIQEYKLANQYSVTLNGNGATTPGSTFTTVIENNDRLDPIKNPAKRVSITYVNTIGATISGGDNSKNYTFNGWYTTASGGSKVASNATTPVLQANVSGYTNGNSGWIGKAGKTLYAHWNPVTATLPTVAKKGHICKWTTDNGANSVTSGGTWSFTSATSRTFTAVCTPKTITVTFKSNGGTGNDTTQKFTYGVSNQKFSDKGFKRTNYTQGKWAESASGSGVYNILSSVSNDWINNHYPSITLYATWILNKPTCTLTAAGTKGKNGWYTGNITLSLSTSGVVTSKGIDTNKKSTNGKTSITVTSDTKGTTYYGYVANSSGGNHCNVTVKRDTIGPSCDTVSYSCSVSRGVDNWCRGKQTLSTKCKSDATSGCNSTNKISKSFDKENENGSKKIDTISDKAGNTTDCKGTVKIDTTAPTLKDYKYQVEKVHEAHANSDRGVEASGNWPGNFRVKLKSVTTSDSGSGVYSYYMFFKPTIIVNGTVYRPTTNIDTFAENTPPTSSSDCKRTKRWWGTQSDGGWSTGYYCKKGDLINKVQTYPVSLNASKYNIDWCGQIRVYDKAGNSITAVSGGDNNKTIASRSGMGSNGACIPVNHANNDSRIFTFNNF